MSGPDGKIIRSDGTDVSNRDRSKDGTIILRRGREAGHNYFFGGWRLPWHLVDCPKCGGRGLVTLGEWDEDGDGQIDADIVTRCDLCLGVGEVKQAEAKRYLREQ